MPHIDSSLTLALSSCIGAMSAYIAVRQGRNPYLWFFIGMFFGLIGIMAIFIAPPKKRTAPLPPSPQIEEIIIGPSEKCWYYLNPSHEQVGPTSFALLNKVWKSGVITKETLVWHEELPDWKPLKECIKTTSSP